MKRQEKLTWEQRGRPLRSNAVGPNAELIAKIRAADDNKPVTEQPWSDPLVADIQKVRAMVKEAQFGEPVSLAQALTHKEPDYGSKGDVWRYNNTSILLLEAVPAIKGQWKGQTYGKPEEQWILLLPCDNARKIMRGPPAPVTEGPAYANPPGVYTRDEVEQKETVVGDVSRSTMLAPTPGPGAVAARLSQIHFSDDGGVTYINLSRTVDIETWFWRLNTISSYAETVGEVLVSAHLAPNCPIQKLLRENTNQLRNLPTRIMVDNLCGEPRWDCEARVVGYRMDFFIDDAAAIEFKLELGDVTETTIL